MSLSPKQERYLCFSLGEEEYAIPLLSVKEVLAMPEVTPVPQTPSYFLGIMNLRGQVISIMNLCAKLGIKPLANNPEPVVVICQVGELVVGITVDSVNSVLAPKPEELSPRPEVTGSKSHDYVTGVYRQKNHLVLLLDVGGALSLADRQTIQTSTRAA